MTELHGDKLCMPQYPPLTPREHHWNKMTRNHQLEKMQGNTDAEAVPETFTRRLDCSATAEFATNSN